ncbi:MazG family protein [Nocardioides zeae]|uniref:MazG family protein n=2 Tax=Nocardioides zeae TaxID=1457234 RepID=A0A6P0HK13_9ACTN|nr:MazG family protein [Nocardioides zeae]NEN78926.1 MazG family protein [Nocardioides zeae]
MARLRRECPWKAEQTHRSLARYLLEEAHEVLEALDTGDAALLREELGDLLLQVYFHAAIAAERTDATAFTIDDVAADLTAKLVRRNPHVFGADRTADDQPLDAAAVNEAWEAVKATEKTRTDPTDGLPPTLPALLWADKVLDRSARAGTPLDLAPRRTGSDAGTIGDRLLGLVAEAREAGVDPEQALRDAVRAWL